MNKQTRNPVSSDGRMTLRAWARSRGVPPSTAHAAARCGRITRDGDGKLDPVRADRQWYENIDLWRVDMRHLAPKEDSGPPATSVLDEWEKGAPRPLTREELAQRYAPPLPEPDESVLVANALSVEAVHEDLRARELVASMNRAIRDIAPKLARPQDGAWLAQRVYDALIEGFDRTSSEWARLCEKLASDDAA